MKRSRATWLSPSAIYEFIRSQRPVPMTMPSARDVWERVGTRGKLLWVFLLPAAFLYAMVVQARNFFYSLGWFKSTGLPKPVISVGNLTVGGTGKTPTCLWLAE